MDILNVIDIPYFKDGSGIHIKEKNKGKFTQAAKQHGMGVLEFASHVLSNKDKYSPTLVKRANFAHNAKAWKHQKGGPLNQKDISRIVEALQSVEGYDYNNYNESNVGTLNPKKDASDVAEFFNSYLKSEGLLRILNNLKIWWEKRHPYRKYYSNFDLGTSRWMLKALSIEPYRYTLDIPAHESFVRPVRITPNKAEYTMIVGRQPSKDFDEKYYFDPTFTLGHEYAHGKTPYRNSYPIAFLETSAQTEALNLNTDDDLHTSFVLEKHADNWGLKYLLYKEGIYDARKGLDITLDQVKELRKRYPDLRPIKLMTDELLMFQINHVAQHKEKINNFNESYFARNGMRLTPKKYQGSKVTSQRIDKANKNNNPTLRKRATFALNSRSWSKKHFLGGVINIIGID